MLCNEETENECVRMGQIYATITVQFDPNKWIYMYMIVPCLEREAVCVTLPPQFIPSFRYCVTVKMPYGTGECRRINTSILFWRTIQV